MRRVVRTDHHLKLKKKGPGVPVFEPIGSQLIVSCLLVFIVVVVVVVGDAVLRSGGAGGTAPPPCGATCGAWLPAPQPADLPGALCH